MSCTETQLAIRNDSVVSQLFDSSNHSVHLRREEKYEPPDKNEIRLCSIEPSNDKRSELRCQLSVTRLNGIVNYKCLSYVWGSGDGDLIALQGHSHSVTPNLHSALTRLRANSISTNIWIDAICINQKDEVEKGQQVAIMGRVFAKAEEVVIWLGEDGVETAASAAIRQETMDIVPVDHVLRPLANGQHFHDLPIALPCRARCCAASVHRSFDAGADWSRVLTTLRSIFNTVWFERAWTVQEIVLAKKARFLYGDASLSWNTVFHAFVNLGHHMRSCCSECVFGLPGDESRALYEMARSIIDLVNARAGLERGQHLVQSLLKFNWKKASNTHDKSYGLLGLQSGRTPTPVVPDYNISLQVLFSTFATDIIRTQGWLVPL